MFTQTMQQFDIAFETNKTQNKKTFSLMKQFILPLALRLATLTLQAQKKPIYVGPRTNTYDDPANGIYVSPSGNDNTGNGSIGSPYKSINYALGKASSGATIILRSGTYSDGNEVRIRQPNITIKSRKGEWAHINLPFPANIKDQNDGKCAVRFDVDASGCKLQCVEISGGFYAIVTETKWDWGQADRSGASNIFIEDCKVHDARYEVIKIKPNCNNITIRYCEIYNPARAEIDTKNWLTREAHGEAIDNVNGDNMKVQNNYMHDVNIGLYAKGGAADVLIENNLVKNAYGAGIVVGFDTSPEFFTLSVNPKYYESIRSIVRNNLIINTGWEGIGLYASKDAEVCNNTVVNAVSIGNALYNSAIFFGIVTQDWSNPTGCPPNINPNIHHNLVSQSSGSTDKMIDIRYATGVYSFGLSGLDGKPVMNNNCYYVAGRSTVFSDRRPSSTLSNAGLAAWKTHIGGDDGSIEVNPGLDADYMPTNTQCAGMGIKGPFIINNPTGINTPVLLSETFATINDGMLFIENPAAETVQVYSGAGTLLFNFQKPEGAAGYRLNQPKGTALIIRGSSGWTKKLFVQ
jgi:hypothetical protein